MAHHVRMAPVRARERSAELGCDVLRIVGYRAACSCDWRGPVRGSVAEARPDGREHVRGAPPAAS